MFITLGYFLFRFVEFSIRDFGRLGIFCFLLLGYYFHPITHFFINRLLRVIPRIFLCVCVPLTDVIEFLVKLLFLSIKDFI
jgi:hypothetical protein